ncbi:MAG: glycosyltransferase [Phycisphaerae bacterium]|jgi:glycosyltransferase involved in cell wall biosynthesis
MIFNSNKKIKVCLFSTVQGPDNVRLYHREAKSLVKEGFEVHAVLPCDESFEKGGVYFHKVHKPNNRFIRIIFMPWKTMITALRTRADIYHFHDPELLMAGFLLRWILGKKVVFDMRESTSRQILGKEYLPKWTRKIVSCCYKIIEKICLTGIRLIVANDRSVNEYHKCYLVRNFPQIDENIISNAMDMSQRFKSPLLVYVGTVSKTRGAFTYLVMAQKLIERGHRFKIMIIGGAYDESFIVQLKDEVKQMNLQDTVSVTGFMDYQQAMGITSKAVIGLSILDPIPNYTFCLAGKMVEYMMCGTPILSSNFEHWAPYVEGEKTGKMVDPFNIDQIVNVCEQMLNNPQELENMGRRGIEAVKNKYNWDMEFKVLLKCYQDMLST